MQAATEQCRNKETGKRSLHNLRKKVVGIIGGESEALGFHQETTEESRNDKIGFV